MAATPNNEARWAPARPSWVRLSLLASTLLIGWALLVPAGHRPQWWQLAPALAITAAFVSSWHGQHLSSVARRWAPMAWRNHLYRNRSTPAVTHRRPGNHRVSDPKPALRAVEVDQATIVIHLQPHPYALSVPPDADDQLPWQLITAWLDRYGIRADNFTVTSVVTTPPPSSLRRDHGALVSSATPQNRHTWISYTLHADTNMAAIAAGRIQRGSQPTPAADPNDPEVPGIEPAPARTAIAELAAITARRLIAELSEHGWLATDVTHTPLLRFTPRDAPMRRECWTGTEYADGFRAVYQIDPHALSAVLGALATIATKSTWISVTVRQRGRQPATIEAAAALLTTTRAPRHLVAGMHGMHGLHRQAAERFTVSGLADMNLTRAPITTGDLTALSWRTTSYGVPLGSNQNRQPVYLNLDSPEPTRITITGAPDFHRGICGRLALSGRPMAIYTSDLRPWTTLANLAGPRQISLAPSQPPAGAIIVGDGSTTISQAAISVMLRPPTAPAPTAETMIMITQHPRSPEWFQIITPRLREQSAPRLRQLVKDFRAKNGDDPDATQRRSLTLQADSMWLNARL